MKERSWTLQQWWDTASSWDDYLASVEKNAQLWHGVHDRVKLSDLPPAESLLDCSYLLALSEDWCGDAANSLPVIAHMARHYEIEFRVLARDANLQLMDQYLTNGRSRSIPVVIAMDCDFQELAWWGSRPSELQRWVISEGMKMGSAERYKEVRRWYARDKGTSTVREVLAMLAAADPA